MGVAEKIILDLCGGTGAWSAPYKKAGYDVRVITLPENDVREYAPPEGVYGILAAPPCTMFSLARQNAKTPRDFAGAMEVVKACLNIIWQCRIAGRLKFWAMENPRGYLRQFLGHPALTFKAYEYGDPWVKRTEIWGYFKMPIKNPIGQLFIDHDYIEKVNGSGMSRQAKRSITPPGFAQAFYLANQ